MSSHGSAPPCGSWCRKSELVGALSSCRWDLSLAGQPRQISTWHPSPPPTRPAWAPPATTAYTTAGSMFGQLRIFFLSCFPDRCIIQCKKYVPHCCAHTMYLEKSAVFKDAKTKKKNQCIGISWLSTYPTFNIPVYCSQAYVCLLPTQLQEPDQPVNLKMKFSIQEKILLGKVLHYLRLQTLHIPIQKTKCINFHDKLCCVKEVCQLRLL